MNLGIKKIGSGHPAFIVAEMSGNHDGNIKNAISLIKSAKGAGADAIKLQTYSAESITMNVENKDFFLDDESPWSDNKTLWDLYSKAETPLEWHEELFYQAKKIGLEIFSSPFDEFGVDLLDSLGVSAFKIASPEINHIPLIAHVAKKNKPVIFSTGVANKEDIELAIKTVYENSNKPQIILLQCNSAYPSPYEDSNLLTISDMYDTFKVIPGYSDHTIGSHCAIAAIAMGAKLIEKHICHDEIETVDSFFSMNPENFKQMIIEIRQVEKAIGCISYDVSNSAKQSLNGRRSLYISKEIKKGEQLSIDNIKCIRPAHGLAPKYYELVLGKKVLKDLYPGDRLSLDLIE